MKSKFRTLLLYIFFFFSSRRRHTRLVSDWSSDVCSSDLKVDWLTALLISQSTFIADIDFCRHDASPPKRLLIPRNALIFGAYISDMGSRSEERRVGKECRSRWSPYH